MALCASFSATTAAAPSKPNIILILADDLGWNALACQGNRDVETPNLDRLAEEGMRFTQAYAEAQCSPTRGAIFSGQWPARTGMFAVTHEKDPPRAPLTPPPHAQKLPPETASLALRLRAAGYATGMSGKWHIGDDYNAAPLITREGGRYFDAYGFDFIGPSRSMGELDKHAQAITDDLLGFIAAPRDRPFFAYFAHHTAHAPMEAPAELVAKYVAKGLARSSSPNCLPEERPTADYYAMVEHLDTQVGRVLAKLDELAIADNTLVLFTSDNGGLGRMANLAPLRESKGSPYEGGIRVPFIVRWPGQIAGATVCDTPVHVLDLYPTFMDVARGAAAVGHILDGETLLPLLMQTGPRPRDTLYWHLPTYTPMFGRTPCSVIRKGDWKLVRYYGDFLDTAGLLPQHGTLYGRLVLGARTELYNLRDDPGETRDLASAEPQRTRDLQRSLDAFLQETHAALPTPNLQFDPRNADWWRTTRGE